MNLTVAIGNLTKDVELQETSSGTAYCNFSLAVNGESKGTNGERLTHFYPCTAWRSTAENIAKYCKKGSRILVRGEFQQREYTDKEGNKKTSWNLVVNIVEFLGNKQGESESGEGSSTTSVKKARQPITPIDDDRLPF